MGSIDLVVTDLDGTLWDHGWVVSDSTREALSELERREIPVIAATARGSLGAKIVMQQNGISLPAAILLNGALGLDLYTNERFHAVTFGVPSTQEIVRAFVSNGVQPCAYVEKEHAYVVTSAFASSAAEYLEFVGDDLTYVDDMTQFFANEEAFGIMGIGVSKSLLEPIVPLLEGKADARFIPEKRWGEWSLFAAPPGITKWEGVRRYCEKYGLSSDNVLAIGDAGNDLDLLNAAAVSCAMPESTAAILDAADYVVSEWADVLKYAN